MKTAFDTGMNRTGIATAPVEGPKTIEGAEQGGATSPGDGVAARAMRLRYAREAEPVGTVPPPSTLKGVLKTAAKALKGDKATVFIDKLAERLAFERSGARLYELVLTKLEAYPSWEGGPTRADLLEIQRDELSHFGLLQECVRTLGADPTAMTPSADIAINLSKGVPAVLADPRTDVRQCLEGLLVAELTDNACWEVLIALAREVGQETMIPGFEQALATEAEHLLRVQAWVERGTLLALEGSQPRERPPEAPPPA